MEWWYSTSPKIVKFKQTILIWKIMCTVFYHRKGMLLVNFFPHGDANSSTYCEALQKPHCKIQNKRHGVLSKVTVLLHDNASNYFAGNNLISLLTVPIYHLFLHWKMHLDGQRCDDDNEVKMTLLQWLSNQVADFYDDGIQKRVVYIKCLISKGNDTER